MGQQWFEDLFGTHDVSLVAVKQAQGSTVKQDKKHSKMCLCGEI